MANDNDNPRRRPFFSEPTPFDLAQRDHERRSYNLKRYGREDYTNERKDKAWNTFDELQKLPVGPERSSMCDRWMEECRDARRFANIEAARHRRLTSTVSFPEVASSVPKPTPSEILHQRAQARAAAVAPMRHFAKKRDEPERDEPERDR